MAKSKGYRVRVYNREEICELRRKLGECHKTQWQRASHIMQRIAELTPNHIGPSGSRVEPRSCRYCGYYGHTRQHCEKRQADEAEAVDREIEREAERRAGLRREKQVQSSVTQESIFDSLGIPYTRDPLIGPIWAIEEGEGDGLYKIIREGGRLTVKKAPQ